MIYSIMVLLFGIYIGQEYPELPSVKNITVNVIHYTIDCLKNENDNKYHAKGNREDVKGNREDVKGNRDNLKSYFSDFLEGLYI